MCADELHQSREVLVAFGLGQVDEAAAKTIAEHLETCADCLRVVTEAPADDFLHRVREAAAADALDATVSFELAGQEEYEIVREIGRGGMGVVYLARNRRMDRLEALKVMQRSLVERRTALDRFEQEIRSAARLHHPNIVTAYNAPHWGGALALAMEYVPGEDLHQLVQLRGPMSVVEACLCGHQAALALQHAHEKGMVHRDIKPSNLMLTTEGGRPVVKVLDFGLSKATSESPAYEGLTMEGQLLGSLHFIAPEQAIDAASAGIRADLYSLGCTLYYLLVGRPPFQGKGAYELVKAHEQQSPEPLDAVRSDVPPALAAVIAKLMAKKPEERFRTPGEAAEALLPFTAGLPFTAAPASSPAAETQPRRRRSTANRLGLAAALAGCLAFVAAAAYVIRIHTGEGEVVVTSEVDGLTVDVERNGKSVKDGWQIRQGADNRWVVRSGVVNVTLPAKLQGEFTLEQDKARLFRDGQILVTITRKAAATPQETPVAAAIDRDRAAAEWVLEQGGAILYVIGPGKSVWARSPQELPSEAFQVYLVSFLGRKAIRSADLERLVGLPRLEILQVANTAVDAEAIPVVARMPLLFELDLTGTRIKLADLRGLASMPRLGYLSLSLKADTDGDWAAIEQLHSLRQLTLSGDVSAIALRRLSTVKQLRTIWLPQAASVDDEAVAELQAANPLCRVLVGMNPVKSFGRDPVAELERRLRTKGAEMAMVLFPGYTNAAPTTADLIAGKPLNIASIKLPANALLDGAEARELACPFPLWHFRTRQLTGADRCAEALAGQVLLTTIDLFGSDLTDAGLEHLKQLPSLVDLSVEQTKVTQAGVDSLQKALPDCKIHWSPAASPPAPSPVAIDRDRAAADWVLAQGGTVGYRTESGKAAETNASKGLPEERLHVHSIGLWEIKSVGSADLDRLVGLPQFDGYLGLSGTNVDGDAIPRIAKMREVYNLGLDGTRVKSSELVGLAPLSRLAYMRLSPATQIDDGWAGLQPISSLRELELVGAVSADALRSLGKATQLRTIWIKDYAHTDEQAVSDLQKANPLCRVVIGNAAVAVGRDPVGELAQHLLKQQSEVAIEFLADRSSIPAATDADINAGRPFDILKIKIPPNVSLDEEALQRLRCPCKLYVFAAYHSTGADRYVAALAGQPITDRVMLAGSDLTDAGLEHLKTLPSLADLDVRQTKVTQTGVDSLQKALPNCKIKWSPAAPPAAPSNDPDRAAAEWVLARGGWVGCINVSGGGGYVKTVAELPAEPFKVTAIELWDDKLLTNADLDRFVGLPRLKFFVLGETEIDSEAIERLVKMPRLNSLTVSGTYIKSSHLAGLAPLQRLTLLALTAGRQNDDAWAALERLPSLRRLQLYKEVSSDDIRDLGKAKQLRTIWLAEAKNVNEQAVAELQVANPLCRVLVGVKTIEAVGRDPESELAKRLIDKKAELEMVISANNYTRKATEADLASGKPVTIDSIALPAGVSLDDEELPLLNCLEMPHRFTARQLVSADRYAAALADAVSLLDISLAGSDLTDVGLEHLKQLPSLEHLDVQRTKVTPAGVEALQKALPECKVLW